MSGLRTLSAHITSILAGKEAKTAVRKPDCGWLILQGHEASGCHPCINGRPSTVFEIFLSVATFGQFMHASCLASEQPSWPKRRGPGGYSLSRLFSSWMSLEHSVAEPEFIMQSWSRSAEQSGSRPDSSTIEPILGIAVDTDRLSRQGDRATGLSFCSSKSLSVAVRKRK